MIYEVAWSRLLVLVLGSLDLLDTIMLTTFRSAGDRRMARSPVMSARSIRWWRRRSCQVLVALSTYLGLYLVHELRTCRGGARSPASPRRPACCRAARGWPRRTHDPCRRSTGADVPDHHRGLPPRGVLAPRAGSPSPYAATRSERSPAPWPPVSGSCRAGSRGRAGRGIRRQRVVALPALAEAALVPAGRSAARVACAVIALAADVLIAPRPAGPPSAGFDGVRFPTALPPPRPCRASPPPVPRLLSSTPPPPGAPSAPASACSGYANMRLDRTGPTGDVRDCPQRTFPHDLVADPAG